MTAQQVSEHRHGEQHRGKQEVVALPRPLEQYRIAGLVDREAARGNHEEPRGGGAQRRTVVAKGQSVVAGERHREGDQPAEHIGHQRLPAPAADQADDHRPMHRRRGAADGDEKGDASARGGAVHGAGKDSRTICICVDDFGLHAGINDAALRLAAQGWVHAIGCLVGSRAWTQESATRLRALDASSIDIGLHLDFTECPLLPRSRRALPSMIAASLLRRLDTAAIRAEIQAQLDAFEQALGRGPAFVDGHQHVHQLPVVRQELLDELRDRYRTAMPWLRSTRGAQSADDDWGSLIKRRSIEMLGTEALTTMARRMGFPQNHCLLGVYDFGGGTHRYRRLMSVWLRAAQNADLLMCHPSLRPRENDPLLEARHAEYQVLASVEFGTLLRAAGVALQSMSRILARASHAA